MLSRVQGEVENFFSSCGSQRYFFYSGTQFLLLCGSGSHFFSSQTRVALSFRHYVNLFHSFRVWHALFSALGPQFFASIRVWFALFFSSQTRGVLLFWHYVNLFPFSTGLHAIFLLSELRLFLLSAPDSNLFDDSSHIFQHCFIPFSHLSGILIIVKRKSPLTQFLFHNMAGKYPTSYRLLLLFIK